MYRYCLSFVLLFLFNNCSYPVKFTVPKNYQGNLIIFFEVQDTSLTQHNPYQFSEEGMVFTSDRFLNSKEIMNCYYEDEIDVFQFTDYSNTDELVSNEIYLSDFIIGGKVMKYDGDHLLYTKPPYILFLASSPDNREKFLDVREEFLRNAFSKLGIQE